MGEAVLADARAARGSEVTIQERVKALVCRRPGVHQDEIYKAFRRGRHRLTRAQVINALINLSNGGTIRYRGRRAWPEGGEA